MTAQIFTIIAPVFLIAALGYGWARMKLPFHADMVTRLVSGIGAPCLLLSQLLRQKPAIADMTQVFIAAGAAIGLCAAVGMLLLTLTRQPARAYLPAMIFPNAGNMGMPLCLFAFGETGLALAVAYFAMNSLLQFSAGVGIASGHFSFSRLLRTPVLWALLLALVLRAFDLDLPGWTLNTLGTLGNLVIPLMLMSLGVSLGTLSAHGLGRAFLFAAFRVGGGFLVGLMIVTILGLNAPVRGVVLIQSAMPAAVFNYLFAAHYNNRPSDVAGIVLISTALSFLTLPLLLAYVLSG